MKSKYDVYIGRYYNRYGIVLPQSKWANPYIMERPYQKKDGTREEVIEKYRIWIQLPEQWHLIDSLPELNDKVLGCWCAPEPCHGNVLKELAEGRVDRA